MGNKKAMHLPYIPLPCLVDTNVVVTANGNGPLNNSQASDDEVEACIHVLLKIKNTSGVVLVLDDENRIFNEYKGGKPTTARRPLSYSGQPGIGDEFFTWVHDHQHNTDRCERRTIHCTDEATQTFAEFPDMPELKDFDREDRKFAAVANADTPKRPILEFGDSKWWTWKEGLAKVGINVVFLTNYAEAKNAEKEAKRINE
jgi:hypothetical protein